MAVWKSGFTFLHQQCFSHYELPKFVKNTWDYRRRKFMHAYIHIYIHTHTNTHTHPYIPWIHKCVINKVQCGKSENTQIYIAKY
jgi:hypothetical protein